jgi:hypothetical protein
MKTILALCLAFLLFVSEQPSLWQPPLGSAAGLKPPGEHVSVATPSAERAHIDSLEHRLQALDLASQRLKDEQEVLLDLLVRYTDSDPAVAAQRSKIHKLETFIAANQIMPQAGASDSYTIKVQLVAELSIAYENLNDLLARHPETHPLILDQRREVATLERRLASLLH